MITDKHSERFEKLLKYDKAAFEECFMHGAAKMITPLLVKKSFKENAFEYIAENDPMVQAVNKFTTEFSKSQILNNVEGILDLYPRISFEKFAKIMGVSESESRGILEDFRNSKTVVLTSEAFDQTVISKIVNGVKCIKFSVDANEILVDTELREESHIKFFQKNSTSLEAIIGKIELL